MEAWRWDNACLMIGGDVHLTAPNAEAFTFLVLAFIPLCATIGILFHWLLPMLSRTAATRASVVHKRSCTKAAVAGAKVAATAASTSAPDAWQELDIEARMVLTIHATWVVVLLACMPLMTHYIIVLLFNPTEDVMFGTEPVAYAGLAAIMAVIISMELAVRICIRPNWFIVVHHAFSLIVAAGLGYLGTSASFKVALIVMSILPYELPLYVLLVMKRLALCSRRRLRSLIIPSLTVFFVARVVQSLLLYKIAHCAFAASETSWATILSLCLASVLTFLSVYPFVIYHGVHARLGCCPASEVEESGPADPSTHPPNTVCLYDASDSSCSSLSQYWDAQKTADSAVVVEVAHQS